MASKIEYTGEWYRPDDPQVKIPGTLIIDEGIGITLKLSRELPGVESNETLSTLLGKSGSYSDITLLDCLVIWNVEFLGVEVSPGMAIVGGHFSDRNAVAFTSVTINYPLLTKWAGSSGFYLEKGPKGNLLGYAKPERLLVTSGVGYEVCVDFSIYHNVSPIRNADLPMPMSIEMRQNSYVKIQFVSDHRWAMFEDIMRNLQDFLALGCSTGIYPYVVAGRSDKFRFPYQNERGEHDYSPLYVYIAEWVKAPKQEERASAGSEMLFKLDDIGGELPTFFHNWASKRELLSPVYDLYFGVLSNPTISTEFRFLAYAQALESYHRRTMSSSVELPRANHRRRKKEIIDAVPEAYKGWLSEKLAYSNELTLRGRLQQLLDKFGDILSDLIPDRDAFISDLANTRNYRTHFDVRLIGKALEGTDLYHFTERLRIFLDVCLLHELGFAHEDIKLILEKNSRYRRELVIVQPSDDSDDMPF